MDKNEIQNKKETIEQISDKIDAYKKDIEKELKEIENSPDDFEKIIKSYNNIFKIDNTQEIYVLNYLLYLKHMTKKKKNR